MNGRELTRREFTSAAVTSAAAGLSLLTGCSSRAFSFGKSGKRPNFVFIMTDDQKWDAVGFEDEYPFLETPRLDKIASEGTVFKNVFVTTALCSPSRATCLTGMYAHDNGVPVNEIGDHRLDVATLQRTLRQNGYEVAFIGKWHQKLHARPRPDFDYWLSFRGQGQYFDPELNENGREFQAKGYMTDILTDYAQSWLEEKRDKSKPFCLFLWHKAVHGPFKPAPEDENLYADDLIPEPGNYNDDYADKGSWLRRAAVYGVHRDAYLQSRGKPTPDKTPPAKKWTGREKAWMDYLKTIAAVDRSTGRVYDTLKTLDVLDDTFFMFTSDNGYLLGNHHSVSDKRIMWEESIKIPLIIRYPRLISAGTKIDQMVLNVDFAPTFIDLAGVSVPRTMQGESFVPLLRGKTRGWRTDFLYEYFREGYAPGIPSVVGIRTERYKLVEYPELEGNNEMYDLKNDPLEMTNLYYKDEYADIRRRLSKRLEELKNETGYKVPDYPF
jgi:N-acetylglucosamine-6-sulfatase